MLPKYPVYVISKGRWRRSQSFTADTLVKDGVPFRLVVEPQEKDAYAARFGEETLHVLPFSNLGQGSIPARNWVWEHAVAAGEHRHWILDDNIRGFMRRYRGKRMHCVAGVALAFAEEFVDRYENVAVAGLNYFFFVIDGRKMPPFYLNNHVYSCMLILNSLPYRWRGRYNEDTDLCLQVLSGGWCTILFNAFMIRKTRTMTMSGGNTDDLYTADGRLKMARSLERMWPGVVETRRRFQRPQHYVYDEWKRFDTPLKLRENVDLDKLPAVDEKGMEMVKRAPVKSLDMQRLLLLYQKKRRRDEREDGQVQAR